MPLSPAAAFTAMNPAEQEQALSRRILGFTGNIAPTLQHAATRHILDFAGVTLAGTTAAPVQRAAQALTGVPAASGSARLLGSALTADPCTAILLNAMAGHIHDFDDDETQLSIAHTTVPVMAAAWTLADIHAVPGTRVIAAYLAGVETMMRLGQMINPKHYRKGWHATATLGTFGAAAASAIILGLDENRLLNALRFAATMSAGIRSSFGSDGKSMQVARAARNGYEAVLLAQAGLECSPGTLFGTQGFVEVYDGAPDRIPQALADFGRPSGLESPGITIKAYPCCTATHAAIDAVLALATENRLDWRQIGTLEVSMGVDLPGILIHDRPATGLEGKFSMRYCAAAAARFGKVGIQEFEAAALQDDGVRDMMERVNIVVDTATPRPAVGLADQAGVTITMANGKVMQRAYPHPTGSVQRPFTDAGLGEKFLSCAAPVLGLLPSREALAALFALASAPDFTDIADRFHRTSP